MVYNYITGLFSDILHQNNFENIIKFNLSFNSTFSTVLVMTIEWLFLHSLIDKEYIILVLIQFHFQHNNLILKVSLQLFNKS
jgi:hypothetical protein